MNIAEIILTINGDDDEWHYSLKSCCLDAPENAELIKEMNRLYRKFDRVMVNDRGMRRESSRKEAQK